MPARGAGRRAVPTDAIAGRLRFDRYVLDLDRGCLLAGGEEIALRPKSFALLRSTSRASRKAGAAVAT
jgi:hypothetical protein